MKTAALLLLSLMVMSGCGTMESKRIFQRKVVEPVVKEVTEDIKQGVDYLAKNVEEPAEAKVVAIDLAQRVGAPEKPLSDPVEVSKAVTKGSVQYDRDVKEAMDWLKKNQGTKLEGTGLSILGTGGFVIVIAIVLLCVFVPVLSPLILNLIQIVAGTSRAVLKQTTTSIHSAIKEFNEKNPKAAEELKGILSRKMDLKSKTIIKKIDHGSI
jgi:hypothetical protein